MKRRDLPSAEQPVPFPDVALTTDATGSASNPNVGVLYDPGSAAGLVATDPQGVHAEPPAFTTSTFFGVLSRNVGRFIVSVEGPSWHTSEVIELPRLPEIGDPIETQYGTLLVAEALATPGGQYAGKIVCRMPG